MADCTYNVSKDWDFTLPENQKVLESALYNTSEKFFLVLVIIIISVGLLANIAGFFTLIRNRSEWDTYKCYLMCLAMADFLYLLSGLIFFTVPYSKSPVSFDVPFGHCYVLIGSLLFAQVVSAGIILAIAVEAYFRIHRNKPDSPLNTAKSVIKLLAITVVVAVVSVPCAVPRWFEKSTTRCVRWPDLPKYDDFPESITTCPPTHFSTPLFIVFHDIPAFWICMVAMSYCYIRVILRIKKDDTTLTENQKTETVSNLKARIFVFFLCQIVARVYNFTDTVSRHYTDEPIIPINTFGSELIYFILRTLLMLQPAINPFMYFLARDHYRKLVKKAFGRSD